MTIFTPSAILAFESGWYLHPGSKEKAIRETFNLSPIRYYQILGRLIETEEALQIDPVTTRRLLAVRARNATLRLTKHPI